MSDLSKQKFGLSVLAMIAGAAFGWGVTYASNGSRIGTVEARVTAVEASEGDHEQRIRPIEQSIPRIEAKLDMLLSRN